MPVDSWIETTIGEQATLQRGIDITKADQRDGKVPVISSGGVSSYHDTAAVKGPGVVLGRKGVVGSVFFVDDDYWPHDTSLWVKDFHGNYPRFVYYFFKSVAPQIAKMDVGSANPTLNRNHVHPMRIVWPPVPEQQAIAAVLGTLDDKIELSRQINATLEAMARALFQSWFVDFDLVRAKLDGHQPHGIAPATAALFPSIFEDSPLGPIPHGWTATTLADACEQGSGGIQTGPFGTQLHAADYVNEGVPSIMPSDLRDNRIEPRSISRIREQDAERLKTYRVQAGDVVYSRRGDVERRSLIRHSENGWLCGTGCLRVRFGPRGLNPFFGASYLGTLESRAWVVRHAVGATMPNLNTSILGALPMIVPPSELQSRFAEIVGPWDERGTVALEQSRTLATLRDTLLPKLLSGELSVRSASATVDAAA